MPVWREKKFAFCFVGCYSMHLWKVDYVRKGKKVIQKTY